MEKMVGKIIKRCNLNCIFFIFKILAAGQGPASLVDRNPQYSYRLSANDIGTFGSSSDTPSGKYKKCLTRS